MHYLIQLSIAVFSLLSALAGLLGFWVRRLYKELDEKKSTIEIQTHKIKDLEHKIKDLETDVNPLRNEINRCRQELDRANHRIHELNDALQNQNEALAASDRKNVELNHRLSSMRSSANRNAEIANKNYTIAKNLKKIAEDRHSAIQQLQKEHDEAKREFKRQLTAKIQTKDEEWEGKLEQEKERRIDEYERFNAAKVKLEKDNQRLDFENCELTDFREHIKSIVSHHGRIWERELPANHTPFVPLAKRRAPIIAVLNLKGGVGKTTLAANMAATLCDRGKRVLVIDLDYQRSLTQLCSQPTELLGWDNKGECIQHFFLDKAIPGAVVVATPESENGVLTEWALSRALRKRLQRPDWAHCSSKKLRKISKEHLFWLMPCSESPMRHDVSGTLDDTEMHLFIDWLVSNRLSNETPPFDARLRLREALQYQPIQKDIDYVLLDCPPRVSFGCVNALAASDFVLMPVILDEASIGSVRLLLKKIRRLQVVDGLLSNLQVLGIVANRVNFMGERPVRFMAEAWDRVALIAKEAWGKPVHQFNTMIRQNAAFGNAAESSCFAVFQNATVLEWFNNLTEEIEKRIKDASNHNPPIPAKSS